MTSVNIADHDPSVTQRLSEAIAIANIPTLLMVLVQLTGETRWLDPPYCPTPVRGVSDHDSGGLPAAIQDEIREAALMAILAWRAGRPPAVPEPETDMLLRMMSSSVGERVPLEYADMMRSLLIDDMHGREMGVEPPAGFKAIVIGAGPSGLCAAVKLQEIGVDYLILERSRHIGGTWAENRYPGCSVDAPSYLYAYSFARYDWSHYFAHRDEMHCYFDRIATDFGIWPNLRLETEVVEAQYCEKTQQWRVTARGPDGRESMLEANVVISAVGAFTRPVIPPFKSLQSFAGPCVHTARWPDQGLDLAGKRVAVVGNGASAMQVVPTIAEQVKSLTILQRTPQWIAPIDAALEGLIPEPLRLLFQEVPLYAKWYRLRQSWLFNDRTYAALGRNSSWRHDDRSMNETNDRHRKYFERHIKTKLAGRPDLLAKTIPAYPPYGKRMLLDHGWFDTLLRDNVALVTDQIAEVLPGGIRLESGEQIELDAIILATGFDVTRFLAPLRIRGRSGRILSEAWEEDDCRSYLGVTIPDYPNFFMLYGPNTQSGHGGSVIFNLESQMHYIQHLLTQMFQRNLGSVECRQVVCHDYNRRVDEAHESLVWTHPGMDTYYRNSRGRVVVPSPWRIVDFWAMTRRADLQDYILRPLGANAAAVAG